MLVDKIKILFVEHATTIGGGERSLLEFTGVLDRECYDVSFALPDTGPLAAALRDRGERVRFYRAPAELLKLSRAQLGPGQPGFRRQIRNALAAAASLRKVIAAEHPALLHTNSQKAHLLGAWAARGSDVPVIWHMRDILPSGFARAFADMCAAARAARIVAISKAVAGQFRLASSKVTVVYNAVEAPIPAGPADIAYIREHWCIPKGACVIGCVGQLAPWKGQDDFVRVAELLTAAFRGLYFVVVGAPQYGAYEYRDRLITAVKNAGLENRFRFIGHAANAAAMMAAFDALVHVPVEPEPFGRVVVEAMAAGIPVVAADAGGIPEILSDGREGYLVTPGKPLLAAAAVSRLLLNRDLAGSMGKRGCARYQSYFGVERLRGELERVWREVAVEKKRHLTPGNLALKKVGADTPFTA
jgi:glycosyltransferase involved in cell wall biosynthesis